MILAQPILIALLVATTVLYLARLRSRLSDGLVIVACFGFAVLLVVHPSLATSLARLAGIGRGADLVFYVTIPAMALLILLLFARTRDMNQKLTAALREIALADAKVRIDR